MGLRRHIAFTLLAVVAIVLWTGFMLGGSTNNATSDYTPTSAPTPAQLRADGMSWSPEEETKYLGIFQLLSHGAWRLGDVRRVTFEDRRGFHYEALVTCADPLISKDGRKAFVYVRIHKYKNAFGVVQSKFNTFYVQCTPKRAHQIIRRPAG